MELQGPMTRQNGVQNTCEEVLCNIQTVGHHAGYEVKHAKLAEYVMYIVQLLGQSA